MFAQESPEADATEERSGDVFAEPQTDHLDARLIRVLLVDDCALTRPGLRKIIEDADDIEVVGEVPNLATPLPELSELSPHVVVLSALAADVDLACDVDSALNLWPPGRGRVLVLGVTEPLRRPAAMRGAVGTLHRSATPLQVAAALRIVAAGYGILPAVEDGPGPFPPVVRRLASTEPPPAPDPAGTDLPPDGLTRREHDVLLLIAEGRTNIEISDALVLSQSTVKSHVQSLLAKLGVPNRVSAAIYAHRTGLLA